MPNRRQRNVPQVFEVEKIIGKRKAASGDGFQYLLRWKGFPESENSWELESSIQCPELLAQFEAEQRQQRKGEQSKPEQPKKRKQALVPSSAQPKRARTDSLKSESEPKKLSGLSLENKPIEKIIRKRMTSEGLEYLVKWLHYSNSENSWISQKGLQCEDLVKRFERDQEQQRSQRAQQENESKQKTLHEERRRQIQLEENRRREAENALRRKREAEEAAKKKKEAEEVLRRKREDDLRRQKKVEQRRKRELTIQKKRKAEKSLRTTMTLVNAEKKNRRNC